jgi:hypothetical protein
LKLLETKELVPDSIVKKGRKADSPNSHNSINELVHTQPPYSNHDPVPKTYEEDFIYTGPSTDGLVQDNTGKHLMLNLKDDGGQGLCWHFKYRGKRN